jgi:hypothetical protein
MLFSKTAAFTTMSLVAIAVIADTASATYNSNVVGVISDVLTYDDGMILIRLSPMPSGPCSNYFVVPAEVPADGRHMLLSRALTAHTVGKSVMVGYDNITCVNGWYRLHRIG